jgi:hypothetical protein
MEKQKIRRDLKNWFKGSQPIFQVSYIFLANEDRNSTEFIWHPSVP